MRVALLSAQNHENSVGEVRAAFRTFAGFRLIERQLHLALAAECEVIACLADTIGPEIIELQRRCERSGAKFVVVREGNRLAEVINEKSELLLFAPGVLPKEQTVLDNLSKNNVLLFPSDTAVPRGYERVNLEFAWSGVLLAPGAVVDRLAELPSDIDVPSALLRLSLQAGVEQRVLNSDLIEDGEWFWRPDQSDLDERKDRWISAHLDLAPYSAPGLAVAERIGARVFRDQFNRTSTRLPMIAAAISGLAAVFLASFGVPVIGLVFGVLMTAFAAMADVASRIRSASQPGFQKPHEATLTDWAIDAVLIVLVALASQAGAEWLRVFVPFTLFCLLRLGQRLSASRWRASYADRVAAMFLLIPAGIFGLVQEAAALMLIVALLSLFVTVESRD